MVTSYQILTTYFQILCHVFLLLEGKLRIFMFKCIMICFYEKKVYGFHVVNFFLFFTIVHVHAMYLNDVFML